MSGWLLDINVLLGCGWRTHADNQALLAWLLQIDQWATCPLTRQSDAIRHSQFYATHRVAAPPLYATAVRRPGFWELTGSWISAIYPP